MGRVIEHGAGGNERDAGALGEIRKRRDARAVAAAIGMMRGEIKRRIERLFDAQELRLEIRLRRQRDEDEPVSVLRDVVGRDGQSIHDYWGDEPRAFLGITVPGFPNFFMMYGPGTNGGEIVWMLERQAEYAVRVIKKLRRSNVTAVEVRPRWADAYHRWLLWTVRDTAWTVSNNYFKSATGRIVTQWPYGNLHYRVLTKLLGRVSETTRRRAS